MTIFMYPEETPHMEILYLTKTVRGDMSTYDPNDISPQDVLTDHTLHTRWYLTISYEHIPIINEGSQCPPPEDEDTEPEVVTATLDLSLIMVETNLVKCTTWEEFLEKLTEKIIKGYETTLPDQTGHNLLATNLMHSSDFEISYTNILTPEDRNIKTFKWRMPDLAITKLNPKNTTNLDNCICSVNGIVSLPTMFKGELFIKDGARHMSSTTYTSHPSVLLMDFTELGDIEIIPFKDCSVKYYSDHNAKNPYADIKFYLPEHVSLQNKTVFTVLAHSLFFPEMSTVSSFSSIVLSPYKMPIRTSLMKLYEHNTDYVDNTDVVKTDVSFDKYITESMFDDDYHGNFFIIVDNPRIYINKTHMEKYAKSMYTSVGRDGILFDQTTQSFYDYVKNPFESSVDYYTASAWWRMHELDTPYDTPMVGVERWPCVHKDRLWNIHYNKCMYLVKVFGE